MLNQFSRTQLLFGPEAMNKLSQCSVAVFGIGGVGGYAVAFVPSVAGLIIAAEVIKDLAGYRKDERNSF